MLSDRFTEDLLVDDAAFEVTIESLCREIGDRGKRRLPEAVPPELTRAPVARTPGPAPAPAPAPARLVPATPQRPAPVAATPTPDRSFTPSMQGQIEPITAPAYPQQQQQQQQQPATVMNGSFEEMSVFFKDREDRVVELLREQQEMMKEQQRQIQATEARLREELTTAATEGVTEPQLVELQARIGRMHAGKLLKDDELYAIEDTIGDFIDVRDQVGGAVTWEVAQANPVVGATKQLIALSSGMADDAAFSRQVRRKFM